MTDPDYSTTLADLRAALTTICNVITPDVNAKARALYTQGDYPYWTMLFDRLQTTQESTNEWRFDQGVTLTCHVGKVTESGVDVENEAQRVLFHSGVEFSQRPYLQSEGTYARGVYGVHPDGIQQTDGRILALSTPPEQVLAVQVTMTIPLLFQLDRLNF